MTPFSGLIWTISDLTFHPLAALCDFISAIPSLTSASETIKEPIQLEAGLTRQHLYNTESFIYECPYSTFDGNISFVNHFETTIFLNRPILKTNIVILEYFLCIFRLKCLDF